MLGTFIDLLATYNPVQAVQAEGARQALASFEERQTNADQPA
jgi:hypothetical protein